MHSYRYPVLFLPLVFLLHVCSVAQTGGGGTVSSIESKAKLISSLKAKIAELEANIPTWRLEKQVQQEDSRKRLAEALNEIENGSSWKNRRESARNGWEENRPGTCSAGGPPPICVANHWHRVSLSVAWAKYEAYRDEYLKKFHDRIANAGRSQDEKIDNAHKTIAKSYDDIDRLRQEIIALSKQFKEQVVATGKSVQTPGINELMRLVAEKHHIEDRIDLYNVRIADLNQEETKTLRELRDKIARESDRKKEELQNRIDANKAKLNDLDRLYRQRVHTAESEISNISSRLNRIHTELRDSARMNADQVSRLLREQSELKESLNSKQTELQNYHKDFAAVEKKIEAENKQYADKIWDYTVNLSKVQDESLKAVKEAFQSKRLLLQEAIAARTADLQETGKTIALKKDSYRKKFMDWAAKVDSERVRMMRACQEAGCGCFGTDAHGAVVLNWNKAIGCVGEMEGAHKSSDAIYGCVEEGAVYRQTYARLKGNLSNSDADALARATNRTRYDMIFQKVMN